MNKLFTPSGRLYLVSLSLAIIVGCGIFAMVYLPRIDGAHRAERFAEVGEE